MSVPVWPYNVNREEKRVIMTNGAVAVTFAEKNGKVIEVPGGRFRVDGATVLGQERLWLPPAHYKKSRQMVPAILRDKSQGV